MRLICSVSSVVDTKALLPPASGAQIPRKHLSVDGQSELTPRIFGYILIFRPTCSKTEPFDTLNTTYVVDIPVGD